MEEKSKSLYIKRTQRDYPMSFKLAVVREVESGVITNNGACASMVFKVTVPLLNGAENLVTLRSEIQLQQIL